jgi:hypothetical protein
MQGENPAFFLPVKNKLIKLGCSSDFGFRFSVLLKKHLTYA